MTEHADPETGELTTVEQPKQGPSVIAYMANRFGMAQKAFASTVRAICMPPDKNGKQATAEEFTAFLLVAKEYKLNPITKEIYAFPAKGGGIVPIVSIDGWVNLVNSHEMCDGWEFEFDHDEKGNLVSCTCTMHRKDRSHSMPVTEYLSECKRGTDPWKMQHRMLRHKAFIQAARYAFGFSGIYDEDEGETIAGMRDITPPAPEPEQQQVKRTATPAEQAAVKKEAEKLQKQAQDQQPDIIDVIPEKGDEVPQQKAAAQQKTAEPAQQEAPAPQQEAPAPQQADDVFPGDLPEGQTMAPAPEASAEDDFDLEATIREIGEIFDQCANIEALNEARQDAMHAMREHPEPVRQRVHNMYEDRLKGVRG